MDGYSTGDPGSLLTHPLLRSARQKRASPQRMGHPHYATRPAKRKTKRASPQRMGSRSVVSDENEERVGHPSTRRMVRKRKCAGRVGRAVGRRNIQAPVPQKKPQGWFVKMILFSAMAPLFTGDRRAKRL